MSVEKLKRAIPGLSGQESGLSDFSALYCNLTGSFSCMYVDLFVLIPLFSSQWDFHYVSDSLTGKIPETLNLPPLNKMHLLICLDCGLEMAVAISFN
jgi:hypothetical protein